MDNIVIIVFLCVALIAWIAWLIYNYYIVEYNIKENSKTNYYKDLVESYKNKYKNAQLCIDDLIKSIKANFPQSTLKYKINDKGDQIIEGKIVH